MSGEKSDGEEVEEKQRGRITNQKNIKRNGSANIYPHKNHVTGSRAASGNRDTPMHLPLKNQKKCPSRAIINREWR